MSITSITAWIKSEPALVRAAGTFVVGAAGTVGLTISSQQEGAVAAGVMAVLAVVQGWRTRRKVYAPPSVAALLEDAKVAGDALAANGIHPASLMKYLDIPVETPNDAPAVVPPVA